MVSPSAARLMQASRAQFFRSTKQQQWGYVNPSTFVLSSSLLLDLTNRDYDFGKLTGCCRFVYRENRVPYYQRLFQNHDGKRQWWKVGSTANPGISTEENIAETFKPDSPQCIHSLSFLYHDVRQSFRIALRHIQSYVRSQDMVFKLN